MSAHEAMMRIATECGLDPNFPEAVTTEVREHAAKVVLDDPSLPSLEHVPFVTIDGITSKDLDQAVHVAQGERGRAYTVRYALAAAADFVKPGSALFEEALKRGASFYLPGFSVPMLPRELSEGIISLNANVVRRALVFVIDLDAKGAIIESRVERARVRSRRKLAWGDVQKLYDGGDSDLRGSEMESSLLLLRDVGKLRVADARARDVVRYHRREVGVVIDGDGLGVSVVETVRDEVELYNEQISLLVNSEGGRLLREHPSPAVQPIYRIHPGPDPERLHVLRAMIDAVVTAHGLPDIPFRFHEGESLAAYVAALPQTGPHARVARALERQSLLVSLRSSYTSEPGKHFGVGAEPYARFSAPMREMVGVFLHKEAVEMLTGVHPEVETDEALRAEVVEIANRAKDVQRRVADLANELVIDRVFRPELERPIGDRTLFPGTVMGITSGKVHVRLDAPPIDVKLYLRDLGRDLAPRGKQAIWLEPDAHGVVLRERDGKRVVLSLGAEIRVIVVRRDDAQRRWVLGLAP